MDNYLAGKVNSPIPIPEHYPDSIVSGNGPYVFNRSGERFIDLWMGYGSLLFGHADSEYAANLKRNLDNGWFFSYQTEIEKEVSKLLHDTIPSATSVRFATTGSDAVAYAVRAARPYTKRHAFLTVVGGYHGVHEGLSPLDPASDQIRRIPFNNISLLIKEIQTGNYACFLLEPILANGGCVPAHGEFLVAARNACTETGTILIFDEIVTGFRVALDGAQGYYGITPDISLFSKALAGGLPLSAICGRKDILETFIPTGSIFFAGTFNGHPLGLSNVKVTINKLQDGSVHKRLIKLGDIFRTSISTMFEEYRTDASIQGIASMTSIAFHTGPYTTALIPNNQQNATYERFVTSLAQKGILMPPLATETIFLSDVHTSVMPEILEKINEVIKEL